MGGRLGGGFWGAFEMIINDGRHGGSWEAYIRG
jgi:hypothetical protein